MRRAWREYTRPGLRNQVVLDLHDHLDFHENLDSLIREIRLQILEGHFTPRGSQVLTTEKRYGVCRHVQLPTPTDALVLQTIVEAITPIVQHAAPTQRAFYSRSHRRPMAEDEINDTFPYHWSDLWPEFQRRVFEFTKTCPFVVVTDISNYFDGISLNQLRRTLSGLGRIEEVFLDFLFYMVEAATWRPDYLPLTGTGLPQIQFDAPRILAHSFLYEVDRYLYTHTQGNFVRWMDDIDFGVNSIEDAKRILGGLDDMLLARGLHLNLQKTKILSSEDARDYFLPDENRLLTILQDRIKRKVATGEPTIEETRIVRRRFQKFCMRNRGGRWDKVYKRYFTTFGHLGDPYLVRRSADELSNSSDLRSSVFRYFSRLGFARRRYEILRDYFQSNHCIDDESTFAAARVMVEWIIGPRSRERKEIVEIARTNRGSSVSRIAASIWLLAKYGNTSDLEYFIGATTLTWKHSAFLCRQIAALFPLLKNSRNNIEEGIRLTFSQTGNTDAVTVLDNLDRISRQKRLSRGIRGHILHGDHPIAVYPLAKYIMAINVLESDYVDTSDRRRLKEDLLTRVGDPIYRARIGSISI